MQAVLLSKEWIKELRGTLSQDDFGERLGGVTKAMVSKWETGRDRPSTDNTVKLLNYAGLLRRGPDERRTPGVDSPAMTPLHAMLIRQLKRLPEERQLEILTDVTEEAARLGQKRPAHEGA